MGSTAPVLSSDQFAAFLILMVLMLGLFALAIIWSQLSRIRSIRVNEDGNRSLQQAADRVIELLRAQQVAGYKGIENELVWARIAISRATGSPHNIRQFPVPSQVTAEPAYLLAEDEQGGLYYFCDVAPEALSRFAPPFRWPWQRSQVALQMAHPLAPLPRNAAAYRMSIENIGATFDLEMLDLWKKHLKKDLIMKEIWLYAVPPPPAPKK